MVEELGTGCLSQPATACQARAKRWLVGGAAADKLALCRLVEQPKEGRFSPYQNNGG